MRYQIKLSEGQIEVLKQINAPFIAAKERMDLVIGTIVLGIVKKGHMVEIRDDMLVLELESADDLISPTSGNFIEDPASAVPAVIGEIKPAQ